LEPKERKFVGFNPREQEKTSRDGKRGDGEKYRNIHKYGRLEGTFGVTGGKGETRNTENVW